MNFTELKALGDSVAIPTAFIAWLTPTTIPEAAALAALAYTCLRIAELISRWIYRLFRIWRRRHGR